MGVHCFVCFFMNRQNLGFYLSLKNSILLFVVIFFAHSIRLISVYFGLQFIWLFFPVLPLLLSTIRLRLRRRSALLPPSKKAEAHCRFTWPFCTMSARVCAASLQILWLPPTAKKKRARELNWKTVSQP